MSKKLRLILWLFLVPCSFLLADIMPVSNLTNLDEVFADIEEGSLVIFDVDDVLITCKDPALQQKNKERLDKVCRQYAKNLSQDEYMRLFSIAIRSREMEVIDQKIFELLDYLKEKDVKMIALTHERTGRYGVIDKMEDWCIAELKHVGIDFDRNSPFQQEMPLTKLKGPAGSPNIKNGVIFTAELEKGVVLKEAIQHLSKKPHKIIFIDDNLKNLESVEKFCKEQSIAFTGFQYTAVQSRPIKYIDEKLIEIQIDTLFKEERWISSEEAAEAFDDDHL